jgi:Rrf2 family protein
LIPRSVRESAWFYTVPVSQQTRPAFPITAKRLDGRSKRLLSGSKAGIFQGLGVLDKNDVPMHIEHVKLSNKGRYAVRALFDIAFFNDGKPTQVKDIAERQHIPPRFLEQIFQDLKRSGIVGSKRGPQGGYSLSRRAADIRLGDVVRALEGPISLGDREVGPKRTQPSTDSRRVTEIVFRDLSTRVEACFDEVTIADVCTRAEEQGLKRPGAQRYVYVI